MRAALPVLSHLRNSVEDGGNEGSSHFDVSPQFFVYGATYRLHAEPICFSEKKYLPALGSVSGGHRQSVGGDEFWHFHPFGS